MASKVSKRVDFYKERKRLIDSGGFKPMPFPGLPSLTKYVAGIMPGVMYKVTSHSGINVKKILINCIFLYVLCIFDL